MKRILNFMLVACLMFSGMMVLSACKEEPGGDDSKVAKVSTIEEFETAIENQKDESTENDVEVIKLTNDLTFGEAGSKYSICSVSVTIDLNGHDINNRLAIYNSDNLGDTNYVNMNLSIVNNSNSESKVVGKDCGITVMGQGNNDVEYVVTLKNIKFQANVGIQTNGTNGGDNAQKGATVNAINCSFVKISSDDSAGAGAYLPACYTYNFTNCKFTGTSGYYAKSGTHTLRNCTINGNGEHTEPVYNGNGFNPTGAAMDIDSAVAYQNPMMIIIYGGSFNSSNSYGIREFKTGTNAICYASVSIQETPRYSFASGKAKVLSDNSVVSYSQTN